MYEDHEYIPYSFEPAEPEQNNFQVPSPPASQDDGKKPKKRHTALKVTALALSCALLGGVGGGALTAYFIHTQAPAASEVQTPEQPPEEPNVILNSVVHTNTGDKDMTPKEVYNMYVDSVVGVTTSGTTTNIFGQETPFAASGSGFIISEDGYVVTNHHVISGASSVKIALYDGTSYDAEVVGSDASNDVALLKVDAAGLKPVAIGSSDSVAVGDRVAAIGNPLGQLTFTMTVGYVSALDRAINTDGTPINMLQTDAAINSGNSGGPLFDMNGNVVGITTAKYSGQTSSGTIIEGIGFAIPIDDVMAIVRDLQAYGYVTGQAYLGVTLKDLDANTASYYGLPMGCLVDSVTEGSCADKAGVQTGDIITGLSGTEVTTYSELAGALKQHRAGESVTISIYRAGQTLELDAVLDEKVPEEAGTAPEAPQDEAPAEAPQETPRQDGASRNPFSFFFGN